jgi:predicted dehydrogenase
MEALAGGVHVVADQPFAPSAQAARDLVRASEQAGLVLNVFHNRRWDADIRTLAAVLRRGEIGDLWRMESRFDLDDPATLETGPHGGLLRDLGSHLGGPGVVPAGSGPQRVRRARLRGSTRGPHRLRLHSGDHARGRVRSHLSSTKLNRIQERELRAYGSAGSYVARGTDVQAQAIFAGRRPAELGAAWSGAIKPGGRIPVATW